MITTKSKKKNQNPSVMEGNRNRDTGEFQTHLCCIISLKGKGHCGKLLRFHKVML